MKFVEKLEIIDQLQEKIKSYGKFPDDIKRKIDYRFRLDWNYYSNRIEGGTLTKEETQNVMIKNIDIQGKPLKDVMEMQGHDEVISDIIEVGKGIKRLSEKRIKDIHKAIMFEPDPDERPKIGKWKTMPNEIINYKGEKFQFTPPNEVAEQMHDLLNTTNAAIDAIKINKKNSPHPAHVAFQFHNKYVRIHPFYDGNGRTARIFTNLLLISFGYPPIIIKDIDKDRYNQILADIQGYGAPEGLFYNFLADRVIDSMNLVLSALEGKDIEDPDDLTKEIEILKRKQNPPKIEVKKSIPAAMAIVDKDYIGLLDEVDKKLIKFTPLFSQTLWAYLEEPGTDKKIPMNPKGIDLQNLKTHFQKLAQSKGDSQQNFKALYYLRGYKDQNKFDAEISFKLHLYQTSWRIEIFVGDILGGNLIAGLFAEIINKSNKMYGATDKVFEGGKYFINEFKYGEHLSDKQILEEADRIAKKLLEYIKIKADSNSA